MKRTNKFNQDQKAGDKEYYIMIDEKGKQVVLDKSQYACGIIDSIGCNKKTGYYGFWEYVGNGIYYDFWLCETDAKKLLKTGIKGKYLPTYKWII